MPRRTSKKRAVQPWAFVEKSPHVHQLTMHPSAANPQDVLFISDVHWDNPHCQQDRLRRVLDQAVERQAPIICIGDFFCAMQGKGDPRSSKDSIRDEHQRGDYLDSLVETAAKWLEPYKENLCLLTYGNHETSVINRHETDLLDRLAGKLRSMGGITRTGAYAGWIKFVAFLGTQRQAFEAYYHHGYGGGGRATKGVPQFLAYMQDACADIYLSGHVHHRTHVQHMQRAITKAGSEYDKLIDFVRLGTWKDEWTGGNGWAVEKNHGPRPIGGYWCSFSSRRMKSNHRLDRTWRTAD